MQNATQALVRAALLIQDIAAVLTNCQHNFTVHGEILGESLLGATEYSLLPSELPTGAGHSYRSNSSLPNEQRWTDLVPNSRFRYTASHAARSH
jgi:hypothetical protein